jgi:hypothetical protein
MAGACEILRSPWPSLAIQSVDNPMAEFHYQGDAKWIVIRGQLRGHNDTPFGRPTFFLQSGQMVSPGQIRSGEVNSCRHLSVT